MPRVVPASVTIDSIVTDTDTGAAPTGPVYEAALAASVLPDEPTTAAITLAPNDATGAVNHQAEGWWMGLDDPSPRHRWRFSAGFERFASGVLVLTLDTLIMRDQPQSPFESARADSIAVRGLGKVERVSRDCRVMAHRTDERILAVVPDTTPERWMTPRLAWLIDTVQSRFRRIKPDSLACRLFQTD